METVETVVSVVSRRFDNLEPTLAHHGEQLKDMVEQFDAKAAEIRAMFRSQIEPKRTAGARERMLAVGLPIWDPMFIPSLRTRIHYG